MTGGCSTGVGETVGADAEGDAPGCEIPSCVGLSPLHAVKARQKNTAIKKSFISNLWSRTE
jgi:hypothetical protein